MSRLVDWILGRGRDPLARPAPALEHAPVAIGGRVADDAAQSEAQRLGISVDMVHTMHGALRELVAEVAAEPRAWGFDLLAPGAARRDVQAEFRRRTRLTGPIGTSILREHDPLLALAPSPLTTPEGHPLDRVLAEQTSLDPEAARELARHLRSTVQSSLGEPLDRESIEHAVREVAWDHGLDAAKVAPQVLAALPAVTA